MVCLMFLQYIYVFQCTKWKILLYFYSTYFTFAPVMVFTFVEYQITLFPRNIPLEQFA